MQQPPPWRDVWRGIIATTMYERSCRMITTSSPTGSRRSASMRRCQRRRGVPTLRVAPPARVAKEHRRADAEAVERRGLFAG